MFSSTQSIEEFCGINSFYNNFPFILPFELRKSIPENFIVHEILANKNVVGTANSLGVSEKGLFMHCILKKVLIDTPGAIKLLARELKIPSDWIGYAGLKDAHGTTFQQISIFNSNQDLLKNLEFSNISLFDFVRKKYEVNLGDLWGNRFTITMDLVNNEKFHEFNPQELSASLQFLNKTYFPNFFGLQRFGTTRPISHIVGKYLLKKDYESAVKTYLTSESLMENEKISELRKNLSLDWNYKSYLEQLPRNYHYEFSMAKSLSKFPYNYLRALHEIPPRIKKLFISSYQSFIFNEMLSKYISNKTKEEPLIQEFPLISSVADFSKLPEYLQDHLEVLLKKDQLTSDEFKKSDFSFKSKKNQSRRTLVTLEDYNFQLNKDKLVLHFSLPKSTYATMIIREITRNLRI